MIAESGKRLYARMRARARACAARTGGESFTGAGSRELQSAGSRRRRCSGSRKHSNDLACLAGLLTRSHLLYLLRLIAAVVRAARDPQLVAE